MNLTTRPFRTFTQIAALATIAVLAGCHHKTVAPVDTSQYAPTTTAPAPTATITADPAAIDLGQSVVLNWRTQNATTVTIDGIGSVNLNGTSISRPPAPADRPKPTFASPCAFLRSPPRPPPPRPLT